MVNKNNGDILFRKLVEHMNEALWVGDDQEKTIYANPKLCRLLGCTLDELIGKLSYEYWDKESAKKVQKVNSGDRKKGLSSSYEGNLVTKDGSKIPVLVSGTPLPDGGTMGIITNLTDIKKKEEKELMLNTAIEHAKDAVILFDHDGNIKMWNQGAKLVFGFKKEEVLGEKINKVFIESDLKRVFSDSKNHVNLELHAIHRNKTMIKVFSTVTSFSSGSNHGKSYLLIAQDITNLRKLEQELLYETNRVHEAYQQYALFKRHIDYIYELLDFDKVKDKKSIANFVVNSLVLLTRVDACVFRVYNSTKDTLEMLSNFGVGGDWQGKASINFRDSLAEKAFKKGFSLTVVDVSKEPLYQSPFLAKRNNLSKLFLIPLIFDGRIIGSISLYTAKDHPFEIMQTEFLEKYAKLVSIVFRSS